MRSFRPVAAMILGFAISVAICFMQSAFRHGATPPLFPKLFPKPTGQNGYEEFVMAADLIHASRVWQEYERVYFDQPGPTLLMKRRVLFYPTVQRALTLIRAGLCKRIQSPRLYPELQMLVPELPVFRALGRLLGVEMSVHFAEGRNAQAIACLRDALRFGYRIQAGTLFSGVVGLYVDDVALREFGDHLDQLSIQDCDTLIRVANDQLHLPDPEIAVLTAERDMYVRSLKKYRAEAYALLVQVDPGPNVSADDHRAYDAVTQWVQSNPDAARALFDQAAVLVRVHFDQTLAELRRPAWERTYPEPAERDSPAAKLVFSLIPPSFARISDRYTRERALIHILAVHAAVRRYRLQRHALPGSLEALRLGWLARDPFTGASLGYQRLDERTFEIASAGPYDRGTAQRPPSGQRIAITLPLAHPTQP